MYRKNLVFILAELPKVINKDEALLLSRTYMREAGLCETKRSRLRCEIESIFSTEQTADKDFILAVCSKYHKRV
jgi:hypothetical protein